MLIYDDVEQLVADMFQTIEADEDVISVVADKDLVLEILQEMLTYEDVTVDYCNIDDFTYDNEKEYFISLHYDEDNEYWHICVEHAYNDDRDKYIGMGGYVLFHEDVNSKALIDIQNNEMSFLTGHDWFVIGEDDSFESDDVENEETGVDEKENKSENYVTVNKIIYKVNDKEVDKETYDKAFDNIKGLRLNSIHDILCGYNKFLDEINAYWWLFNL